MKKASFGSAGFLTRPGHKMNTYNRFIHNLKILRWEARRASAAVRWGSDNLQKSPFVLGNAMPKSGSHLISQVVQGLTQIGPFVNPGFPPANRNEVNDKLPDQMVLTNLKRMRPGDIAYGYIKAKEPFISLLTENQRATIFVYRDPRDMIVSHVFYATEMHPNHGMHRYYTETLKTMEERINAAIQGVEEDGFSSDTSLSPIRKKYEGYMGWLAHTDVLCLRFEDLILNRKATIGKFLDYLEQRGFSPTMERERAINILEQIVTPKKSGTFRKAQPGNWREHFTEVNKLFFKDNTGDLLIKLGYEIDKSW